MPTCACGPCPCCPDVCHWATNWHKTLTEASVQYANPAIPGWFLTDINLTQTPGLPDWLYLSERASVEGVCDIGGLYDVNCIPYGVVLSGTVTYTSATFGDATFNVSWSMTDAIILQWPCDNPDGYLFSLFGGYSTDSPTVFINGSSIDVGSGADPVDIALATNYDGDSIGNDVGNICALTFPMVGASPKYSSLTIIPLYQ